MNPASIAHILSLVDDPNVRHASIDEDEGKTYIRIRAYSDDIGDYGYDGRIRSSLVPLVVRIAIAKLKAQSSKK